MGDFALFPAFGSCANKMMAYLLELAEHPEGHGIRPQSKSGNNSRPNGRSGERPIGFIAISDSWEIIGPSRLRKWIRSVLEISRDKNLPCMISQKALLKWTLV